MSRGFDLVFDQLVSIIEEAVPTYIPAQPFKVVEDGDGLVPRIDAANTPNRTTTLTIEASAYDAGATGVPMEVFRADLLVSVRYNTGDRGMRTKMAGLDAGTLARAILWPPSWNGSVTGLNTIIPPGRDDTETEYMADTDTLYLRMVFVVEYREEN